MFNDDLVVGLATAIAVLDMFFILVAVPESLPPQLRLSSSWAAHISWEQADPFSVRGDTCSINSHYKIAYKNDRS